MPFTSSQTPFLSRLFLTRFEASFTFLAIWSCTTSALAKPFSCLRRWPFVRAFCFRFALVIPAFGRTDKIGVASEARGASLIDLSTLIEGEVALFEARDLGFAVKCGQHPLQKGWIIFSFLQHSQVAFFFIFAVFAIVDSNTAYSPSSVRELFKRSSHSGQRPVCCLLPTTFFGGEHEPQLKVCVGWLVEGFVPRSWT